MSAISWLALGLAILAWPHRRSRRPPSPDPAQRRDHSRRLAVLGVLALLVAGGALAGVRGAVAAGLAAPVVAVVLLRSRSRAPQRHPTAALALDLAAAALRAGRPLPSALTLAAPAADPATRAALRRTARLLDLGSEPATAWAEQSVGPLSAVAEAAVRSHASGVRLAEAFDSLAAELRAQRRAAALARAHRAGVQALAPLAACFLPSFVCLGIVPVIAGVAGSVLGVVR